MPKIIAFAGSSRKESVNKKLLAIAATAATEAGATVTVVDLADYEMPLYNGDLEADSGVPANAIKLKEVLSENDGFIIATPEYNGFFTPLLKNTLDWVSRPGGDESLEPFKGKAVSLISATPGQMSGVRSLIFTRTYLENLGLIVLPSQYGVGGAFQAFDEKGQLKDPRQEQGIKAVASGLVDFLNTRK